MKKNTTREIAAMILMDIYEQGAYSNVALRSFFSEQENLTTIDKAFITEIVNGTLKNQQHIDYMIDQFSTVKVEKMKPWIRIVLRTGVYQMKFMSRVPVSAACNEAVILTKEKGLGKLAGFVNGVLRNIARNLDKVQYPDKQKDPAEYLAVFYSYPKWMIQMWAKQYPLEEVEALCKKSNMAPDVTIRANRLRIAPDDLQQRLREEGMEVAPGNYVKEAIHLGKTGFLGDSSAYRDGDFQVQDESSMLVGEILDPKPGETVMDICAAPGGKATHCAEKMNNQGLVLARDLYDHKLQTIEENAVRLGTRIIRTEKKDATVLDPESIEKADRVMIDAPCSGLGIIRKKPDIKWKKDLINMDELVKIQRRILAVCSEYVRPGGVLVYSTCTICKKENEGNMNWFAENYPFVLESIDPYIPAPLHSETTAKGYIQMLPHLHETDGFFVARFRRKR